MSDPTPAPGWYPAPHANNEPRYWDGARWVDSAPPSVVTAVGGTAPAAGTNRRRGLAIAALVVSIVAFITGLIPVVGIVLGVAAVVLGIVTLVKGQSKGLGITAIALGTVAAIVSLIMTISLSTFAANRGDSRPQAILSTSATEETEPTTEPTEEEPEPPAAPTTPDLSTFAAVEDRDFALIAKDPDAHSGKNLILYGSIMQFDSATGRCAMLIDTAATQKEVSFDYSQSVMAVAGDGDTECPVFDPLVEDDHVKLWVTIDQSFSYDTQIGGNTTVPMVEVWQAELLPATEY